MCVRACRCSGTGQSPQVAVNRHAVGYARVFAKEQNEGARIQQLLAQGVPQESIFVDAADF